MFMEYIESNEVLSKHFDMGVACPHSDESVLSDTGIINVQALKLGKKEKLKALREIEFIFAE